jgi:hypothetical protein
MRQSAKSLREEIGSLHHQNTMLYTVLTSRLNPESIVSVERVNGQTLELISPDKPMGGVVLIRTGSSIQQIESLDCLIRFFQDWTPCDYKDGYQEEMLAKREIISRFKAVRHKMLFSPKN